MYARHGCHKVYEGGVPRQLIEEILCCHKDIFCHQLEQYYNEGEKFLNQIAMWDESWIHYYEPKST